MSSFDFSAYIKANLTSTDHDVQILEGGFTNHTARITFRQESVGDALQNSRKGDTKLKGDIPKDAKSIVLKHAPPYIAADPEQPMSVDRQLKEKIALQVLTADSSIPQHWKIENLLVGHKRANIRIPRFFWHDHDQHVLWIEDSGNMRTLSQVLLDDYGSATASEKKARIGNIKKVASALGYFLEKLHHETAHLPQEFLNHLSSISGTGNIYDYLANMVFTNLKDNGIPDATVLADYVRNKPDKVKDEGDARCLGMVDFWPESVLVAFTDDISDIPECGLVDWEYFGPSNPADELGMFGE